VKLKINWQVTDSLNAFLPRIRSAFDLLLESADDNRSLINMATTEFTGDDVKDRRTEWFVPRFGSLKFRLMIGLLFLPYTGMVLAFAILGSMAVGTIHWGRVLAIVVIYFFGLGVAAHALDALGSKSTKPWGTVFTKAQLKMMAASSLIIAYCIAIYYMVYYVPWLTGVAILEGFFVFAYNLEWFGGRFHTDNWFAFSWGGLPVIAGCIMQVNRITMGAFILAMSMAFLSLVEIKASRPYKELKRNLSTLSPDEKSLMERYESILKSISLGTILLAIGILICRIAG